jgi:O-antigen/teichoic acid export membrane protein
MLKIPLRVPATHAPPRSGGAANGATPRLTHIAYLNTVASLLDYGSTVAVGLLITPILLRSLDTTLFGVWKILQQLVNYLAATDGRPTQALKWIIANHQVSDDYDAKRRAVASALVAYAIYLPILTVIGGVLVWISPTFTKVPPELETVVRIACAILVGNFLLTGLAQIPASVLRGENLMYRRMGTGALLTLIGGVLTVGAASLGLGLVGIAASQIIVAALTAVFFTLVAKRYLVWYGLARPALAEVRRFVRFSTWFLGSIVVTRLLVATDVIILGFLISPSTVAIYAITQFAATATSGLITTAVAAVVPSLGGILGRGQYDTLAQLRREMRTYTWFLASAVGATTILLNKSFVSNWVGSNRYAGMEANVLIVVLSIQFIFIRHDDSILDLTLNISRKVVLGFVAASLSILLAVVLTPFLGIVGLCLGLLVGRAVLTTAYPWLVKSLLGQSLKPSLSGIVRQGGVTTLLVVGAAYAGEQLRLLNWITWAGSGVLALSATAAVCFFVGLTAAERSELRGRWATLSSSLRASTPRAS